MPIYSYSCPRCGRIEDAYRRIDDRDTAPVCTNDNWEMKRKIVPPMVMPDLPEYQSVVSGKSIAGRAQRREDLLRAGCRPYEGREAEEKEAARQRGYDEQRREAHLEESARRAYHELPPEQRRAIEEGGI